MAGRIISSALAMLLRCCTEGAAQKRSCCNESRADEDQPAAAGGEPEDTGYRDNGKMNNVFSSDGKVTAWDQTYPVPE